jgi:hypothetical protein
MWLVAKGAKDATGEVPIDEALTDTLRIWYSGQGDSQDEKTALILVRHARKHGLWIACDCKGDASPPMLSPALLTGADTYYLRRLTARTRPEHDITCPFFREQVFRAIATAKQPARNAPEGWFAVLRPPAISLARAPEEEPAQRDSASHGSPRLAKLMWRMLELSGRSRILGHEDAPRDIAGEFAAICTLAEKIDVAPGIPLSRVLFTHPRDWESLRIFAVLRELAKSWPKGHEPQAFLLVFARKVHEHSIETAEGEIELATRLRHPGTRIHPISGPDLTLVAVGEHPDLGGYRALRAWAQPVHSGHRFIPVDSDFDRTIIEALLAARRILAQTGITLTADKPLFDQITPEGPVRPSWTVTLSRADEAITVVIEPDDENGAEMDQDHSRRRALEFIGPVISVNRDNLTFLTANLKALWQTANRRINDSASS